MTTPQIKTGNDNKMKTTSVTQVIAFCPETNFTLALNVPTDIPEGGEGDSQQETKEAAARR